MEILRSEELEERHPITGHEKFVFSQQCKPAGSKQLVAKRLFNL